MERPQGALVTRHVWGTCTDGYPQYGSLNRTLNSRLADTTLSIAVFHYKTTALSAVKRTYSQTFLSWTGSRKPGFPHRRGDNNLWPEEQYDILHPPEECSQCGDYARHLLYHGSGFGASLEEAFFNQAEDSFVEGVIEGRRLQREDDHVRLSRYHLRLDDMRQQRDEARLLQLRHNDEAELLKAELADVKDMLLAVQLAYEELSLDRAGVDGRVRSSARIGDGLWETEAVRNPHGRGFPATDCESESVSSGSSIDSWPSDVPSFEDDEAFEVMQQLHLMDEWDKEDGGWLERIHREALEIDEKPSSPELVSSDSSEDSDLSSSPASSIVDLAPPEHGNPVPSTASTRREPLTIPQLDLLMASAQYPTKDQTALKQVRLLIRAAERTPKKKRSPEQLYLLATWRKPCLSHSAASSSSSVLSYVTPSSAAISGLHGTPEIFVDASAYGIGFIFKDRWLAWTFAPYHPLIPLGPDKHVVMSWAELIAAELGLLTLLAAGYRNTKIKLRSDNEGVVMALKTERWTPRYGLDSILQRVLRLCKDGGLSLQNVWISTKKNPADGPSRGAYPPRRLMFDHCPEVPQHLAGFLLPVDPAKLRK
ncbi:unnamed protein product [Cyclocybe aegerita]|uniref:Uncharacterized protein n=1 Tax=Cyclocybe aegerita TaxID=1973307 RepID=A0A8S0WXK4_CYCAE|nr:unnamed protein product [Cyclocybe aegerita]